MNRPTGDKRTWLIAKWASRATEADTGPDEATLLIQIETTDRATDRSAALGSSLARWKDTRSLAEAAGLARSLALAIALSRGS